MKLPKMLLTLIIAVGLTGGFALAADATKDGGTSEPKKAGCCERAEKAGKDCGHGCCAEAAKAGKNCEKCGGSGTAEPKK